ncbi:MAG: DNA helicase RecQ [Rhodobacteraceae bacterium]|jgi:ATP-dependent DNA helicase RecQ|nr:DNA helicase RecQ [Paracoccaceae bacterium]
MANVSEILRTIFGFDDFRPGQQEIVDTVIGGKNVLAIMPTGGGKSLCYQLPALARTGVVLVVSPLIALMRDQVRALQAVGVVAGALTSANTNEETQYVYDMLENGSLKLLYLAPERLGSSATYALLKRYNISMIAVDEAHCVSQWGHDFRPDYLKIGELRRTLDVPLSAFTATADAETRQEIVDRLFDGIAPVTFLRGFDRPNIHLAFEIKNNPRQQILAFAGARKGQSGIVYCATRAKTEGLAKALTEAGHNACFYHGGMDPEARRVVETRFAKEDGLIVVATVAFGMGVDKPDIRWVAHADLPKSIEAYYQEIGRAGRDGAPAETLTLYGAEDIRLRRTQIDEGLAPADRRLADHGRLNALLGLAEALTCRRQTLLRYFGEEIESCGKCDLCDAPAEIFDGTQNVRMALSAILRTDESFGAGHLIDILIGKATDKVRARGHETLPTFGVGRALNTQQWNGVFRQMMGHDLIRPDRERHGALRMTESALPILRDEATIQLRLDTIKSDHKTPKIKTLVSEDDAPLLSALKAKRRALAEAADVPAYIVFNDKTLIEMAEKRPQTLDDMAHISGVGAKKLETYGAAFLSVITGSVEHIHPARRKIAGRSEANLYDQLLEAQADLSRGYDGTEKPLSCSAALLAKVAQMRPRDHNTLVRILGERRAERFGQAFLNVLAQAS